MAVTSTKTKDKKSKVKSVDVYKWQGLNRKGKKISGELNATSILELKAQLRKQGITPGKISKKAKPLFGLGGDKKILPADIAVVTRQIATMLGAGVPLVQTIEICRSY